MVIPSLYLVSCLLTDMTDCTIDRRRLSPVIHQLRIIASFALVGTVVSGVVLGLFHLDELKTAGAIVGVIAGVIAGVAFTASHGA